MDEEYIITALSALAQQHRLRAYRALVVAGGAGITAGVMAEELGVSPAALSFQLKELTHAGLIQPVQEGRFVRYRANYAAMTALLNYMTENCCAGSADTCCPPAQPKRRSS